LYTAGQAMAIYKTSISPDKCVLANMEQFETSMIMQHSTS